MATSINSQPGPPKTCVHCLHAYEEPNPVEVDGHSCWCPCDCHDRAHPFDVDDIAYLKARLDAVADHTDVPPDLIADAKAGLSLLREVNELAVQGRRYARRQKLRMSSPEGRHRMTGSIRACNAIISAIEGAKSD